MNRILPTIASAALLSSLPAAAVTVAIPAGTYTQNFDGLPTTFGSTEPLPGWFLRTAATSSSLGTTVTFNQIRAWSHTGGGFKNMSSSSISSSSDATAQNANPDRTLGLRQVQSGNFDPGMAVNFNFSSTGVLLDSISLDLLMLDNQGKSSVFEIQYGLGASPSSFTTLASWTDDPGTFGATKFTFDRSDFGTVLDGQSQVWFRVAALQASTGTGNIYDAIGIDNFSITASQVPEPSIALLGALGAFGFVRRRR